MVDWMAETRVGSGFRKSRKGEGTVVFEAMNDDNCDVRHGHGFYDVPST